EWLHIERNCASLPRRSDSVLKVQRARPEIDDPVMGLQQLSSEKASHLPRFSTRRLGKQPIQIGNSNRLTNDCHFADRQFANSGHVHLIFLSIDPGRGDRRCVVRDAKLANKGKMEGGYDRTSVYQQSCPSAVNRTVDEQIIPFTDINRRFVEPAKVQC